MMRKHITQTRCFLLPLLILALSSCAPVLAPVDTAAQSSPYFRPPTPVSVVTITVVGENGGAAVLPSPTPPCEDNLTFIEDLTIPDGTVVEPESTLDKRWLVENSGNCNWGETYRLRLIAGSEMGAQPEQALYPARSGTRATIRIVFKAPIEPGAYRSAWQAFNPQGEPFGDPFFIEIDVKAPQSP